MRLTCALILLLCAHLARSRPLTKSWQKNARPQRSQPKLKEAKKSKGESSSPTHSPTHEPTSSLSPSPIGTPTQDENVFALDPDLTPDPPTQETLEDETLEDGDFVPLYITVSVSVALSISALTEQFEDVRDYVTKVTTLVVRSHTPFRVKMQRGLETTATELMYDEEHSGVSLVFDGPEVSWWKHSVAYSVTKGPEDQEEMDSIANLTESSVEGAIQSGLFTQLLAQETADVRAVAIPGSEREQELVNTPVKATKTGQGTNKWDYRATVLVTCVGATVLLATAFAIISMRRRRRQRAQEVWGITMSTQRDVGKILSAEWKTDYSEVAAPCATDAPDLSMPSYGTERATTNGTDTSRESKSLT